jgi:ACT domain-containing protein
MTHKDIIVIFSHGFGLKKDNRGLFTEISGILNKQGIKTILFDYNKFNTKTNELFIVPFSIQAKKLEEMIDKTAENNPKSEIVIIGQSQGSFIPTLINNISKVKKVIGVSPFFHTNMKDIIRRYTASKDNELNFTGVSIRKRSDGSTTIIPPEYWKERFEARVEDLYNKLAEKTELVLISPLQDEIMDITDLRKIKQASIINLDGNHDFSSQYRPKLVEVILKQLYFS